MSSFIECSSINLSYDTMGLVTISYTIVHDDPSWANIKYELSAGGQNFKGYVSNASMNKIPFTEWYETHVTLIATTN